MSSGFGPNRGSHFPSLLPNENLVQGQRDQRHCSQARVDRYQWGLPLCTTYTLWFMVSLYVHHIRVQSLMSLTCVSPLCSKYLTCVLPLHLRFKPSLAFPFIVTLSMHLRVNSRIKSLSFTLPFKLILQNKPLVKI